MTEDSDHHIARLGSNVLLDINNGDRLTFARLHPSATLKIGNTRCSLVPLIGVAYGSAFELQKGPKGPCLVRIPSSSQAQTNDDQTSQEEIIGDSSTTAGTIERDNRNLVDDNTAQKLSADDITRMRRFIRVDTLGLMLSLANVGAHTEVLVMDMVGGLLTAAAAERIGGFGSVCSVYHSGKPPPMDIVGLLNFSSTTASRIFRASIWDVSAVCMKNASKAESDITNSAETIYGLHKSCISSDPAASSCDITMNDETNAESEMKDDEPVFVEDDSDVLEAGSVASVPSSMDQEAASIIQGGIAGCVDEDLVVADNHQDHDSNRTAANTSIKPGRYACSSEISIWAKYGFSSLLIGAPEIEPWSIAQELLPLLCCSSPFVIYHPYLQPLVECMHQIQTNKMAVALEILEPWLREYQVLPSRTHPHMQMNANGGYVLTGIKVATV